MTREKLNQCLNCDAPTDGKMFCSNECYHLNNYHIFEKHQYGKFRARTSRALHNAKRICPMCAKEFIARHANHNICSDDCRMNKAMGCKPETENLR